MGVMLECARFIGKSAYLTVCRDKMEQLWQETLARVARRM